MALFKEAIEAAKLEYASKFGNGKVPKDLYLPVRDGDSELEDGKKTDKDYTGHYFFNCSSGNKPGIVDAEGQPILDASEIYSGMFARLILNFYPYNTKGNSGVAAGLNGVQKIRDGEPKSGAGAVDAIFGRYETSEADASDGPGF